MKLTRKEVWEDADKLLARAVEYGKRIDEHIDTIQHDRDWQRATMERYVELIEKLGRR